MKKRMKKRWLVILPILLLASLLFAQQQSVRLLNTGGTDWLTFVWNEADANDRTLNFTVNGASRTFAIHGNLTVESASLINQDLTTDSATATLAGLALTGNLTLAANSITGTSVDINNAEMQQLSNIGANTISAADWATLAGISPEIDALTDAEVQQLQNIGATTISAAQWGYLGATGAGGGQLLAALTTGESTQIEAIGATTISSTQWGYLGATGAGGGQIMAALTTGESTQLETIGAVTITNAQWAYLGGADQGFDTSLSPTYANLSLGTGELTTGSINRASGTLLIEIGGTPEISITSSGSTFGGIVTANSVIAQSSGGTGSDSTFILNDDDDTPEWTFSIDESDGNKLYLTDSANSTVAVVVTQNAAATLWNFQASPLVTNGNVGIGTATIPHGGVGMAKLAIEGTSASILGPHIQTTTVLDDFPLIQIGSWTHDNMWIYFDAHADVDSTESSDAGSNFGIRKQSDQLKFLVDSGIAQGANITWDTAGYINTSSELIWNGGVGINTATIPHGGVGIAKLAIDGTNTSSAGPHVQFTTAADDYPLLQIWPWQHDSVSILFDAYHTGAAWLSSDAGSNFIISKGSLGTADTLIFGYDSGVAQGGAVTWNDGIALNTSGYVGLGGTASATAAVQVTQNSDTLTITGDGSDWEVNWSDGQYVLQTDEGTNTNTDVVIIGKGTGGGRLSIGSQTIPIGGHGYGLLFINGDVAGANQPWITLNGGVDVFPSMQIQGGGTHDASAIFFDAYYDVGADQSSDAGSNYAIMKSGDKLRLLYDSGIAQGAALGWDLGFSLDTAGVVAMPAVYNHDMNGETIRDLQINNTGELGYDSSTRRKKTNIVNMADTSWLYDLRPVNYSPKQNLDMNRWGLIAEEVEEINSNFVFYNEDGQVEGIHKTEFIFPILNEVQKQKTYIESLEARIVQLENLLLKDKQ